MSQEELLRRPLVSKLDEMESKIGDTEFFVGSASSDDKTIQLKTLKDAVSVSYMKMAKPMQQMFISALFAGAYISFGAAIYVKVSHMVNVFVAALVFPVGLSMVITTNADLVTSSMFYALLPFAIGDRTRPVSTKIIGLFRLLTISLIGNCLATFLFAYLFVKAGVFSEIEITVAKIAYLKTDSKPALVLLKAIGANWMVTLAAFQTLTVGNVAHKQVLIWIPITSFVLLSLEHVIANAFFIPAGMLVGAEISTMQLLLGNLIPAFIGNFVGAALFTFGQAYITLPSSVKGNLYKV